MRESHLSICRVCANLCAVRVEVEDGRIVQIAGVPENPLYRGYTCVKGRHNRVLYDHPDRLLHSLKRADDGRFVPIPLDDAVGEIGERLQMLLDRHGPRSIAMFIGTHLALDNPVNLSMADAFMAAIGSRMCFSPNSIDQPGKLLAKGLHGVWMAPGQAVHQPEAVLLIGNNPLVSHQGLAGNPGDFIRDLTRRDGKLIVVDPRRTETAKRASVHLRPRPGEDVAILAGLIRVIIEEHLHDAAFVAEHVTGFETLARTVAPFTPDHVADRADINPDDLVAAARMFGRARRGYASAGTGPNMSGPGTLVEYLVLCLDSICGHWLRAGERVANALSLVPKNVQLAKAQALPPFPTFGYGEKARVRDLTETPAGMPAGALADEILLPGDGRVRALLSLGGNPASCLPDQLKTVEALRSLDLLVQTDVQMSPTAKLAHYVIAPKLAYEMPGTSLLADFLPLYANGWGYPASYAQYTAEVVPPPAGSDVVEQWRLLYRLAQRMGLQLQLFPGLGELLHAGPPTALDMTTEPDVEALFALIHTDTRISLEDVKRHPGGALFPDPTVYVEPQDPGWTGRLDVGSDPMMADLRADASRTVCVVEEFPFRLVCRRMMHVMNSPSLAIPAQRPTHNPGYLNPNDMTRLGVAPGAIIEIASARAAILTVARPDETVREGTVSISHSFGDVPGEDHDVRRIGSNPGRLIANDVAYDRYSGQPRMSNIPVRINPVGAG